VRPDRTQVLSKVFGSCGERSRERDESARRGEPQEPASTELKHRKSPSKHRPKTILSLKESLAHPGKKRCGVCHVAVVSFATHHRLLMRGAQNRACGATRSIASACISKNDLRKLMMTDAHQSDG
jgi:hypothetical protein